MHVDDGNIIIHFLDNTLKISLFKDGSACIVIIKGGNIVFECTDKPLKKENKFIRTVGQTKYYIDGSLNKIIYTEVPQNTKYLSPLKTKPRKINKFIALDIETIKDNDGNLQPVLYSIYDGFETKSFFESTPNNLFKYLLRRKYRGYTVYAHNLSRFDIVFLFKYLANLNKNFKINPIIKDGNIISIKISNKNGVSLTLKDSYLLLTQSLLKLSKTFDCTEIKGTEPVLIDSEALKDEHKMYAHNNIDHYNKDVKLTYNFKEWKKLLIQYCELDCIVLHQILSQFKDLVYKRWQINIEDYPTISSLAFAIYRQHYLQENTIPITTGEVFDFIRQSYTGGSTDMYIPKFPFNLSSDSIEQLKNTDKDDQKLYCYDVNSLYPYVMKTNKYPVGQINKFFGDITILDDKYWIGDASVSTKKDLKHPYLQIHHKTENGLRTVSPNGSFNMIIHKPEYHNALKDYDIQIKNGYCFEEKDIFSNFVENLYNLRKSYEKSHPMNLACKLLMNSLYGRFGMQPITQTQKFMNKNQFLEVCQNFTVNDFIDLGEKGLFVSYEDPKKYKNDHKVSVGIASAVTAYARTYMTKFKNNPLFNLYYSDTDSIFTDKELGLELIGDEIGKFKLEYIFTIAVFLGPKIYGGITTDGKIIIKIKGFKKASEVQLSDLIKLLHKDSSPLILNHDKWYRNLSTETINIHNEIYHLVKTENKRNFIYDDKGIAISTIAISISE